MAANNFEMASSTSSSSTELTEFHLFPAVPRELQDRIWGHSLEGRCIKISMSSNGLGPRYLVIPGGGALAQPIVLQVDGITRREFLKRYPLIFQGRYRQMGAYGHSPVKREGVRFNSDVDTLAYHHYPLEDTPPSFGSSGGSPFYTTVRFLFVAPQADLEHITSLTISEAEMQSIITEGHDVRSGPRSRNPNVPDTFTHYDLVQCLRKLPNLETLLVVFRDTERVHAWTHALTAYQYTDPIIYTKGMISQAETNANMNLAIGQKAWVAPVVGSVIRGLPARHPLDNSKLALGWHWARECEARVVERMVEVKLGQEIKKLKTAEEAKEKAKARADAEMEFWYDEDAVDLENWPGLDSDEEEEEEEEEVFGYENEEDLIGLRQLSLEDLKLEKQ